MGRDSLAFREDGMYTTEALAYSQGLESIVQQPSNTELANTRIMNFKKLPSPEDVKAAISLTKSSSETVVSSRKQIIDILSGKDKRLLAVVGPCSIHNYDQAISYANQLKKLADEVKSTTFVVMRAYFEKPRTTIGWKGFINDPDLDDSFKIANGITMARTLLEEINDNGVPTGTEALDPIMPQYFDDLISWYAIGARTTESQRHREMASGLSAPVGFKNGTTGDIGIAVNAYKSALSPHHFLGTNSEGELGVVSTSGNEYGFVILRGGKLNGHTKPNYGNDSVVKAVEVMREANLSPRIVVDCSHANSQKKHELQSPVFRDIISQRVSSFSKGESPQVQGIMLESNLRSGSQSYDPSNPTPIEYGVSITDACISFEETVELLREGHKLQSKFI